MFERELEKYKALNQLAESDGIVIFGENDDVNIPLGELKQAFGIKDNIYNRSFTELTASAAPKLFDQCIAELYPDTVILHIGDTDAQNCRDSKSAFETDFRKLICSIRTCNKNCRIVIVSLKNRNNNSDIAEINVRLQNIARTEKCEYENISQKREWNLIENSKISSLIYDTGFERPLCIKRPIYNLVRILFCREG